MDDQRPFPPELLCASPDESHEYFDRNAIVLHWEAKRVRDEVVRKILRPAGKQIVMVAGAAGVGKTKLLHVIERDILQVRMETMLRDPGIIPIMGLSCVASETAEFSFRDLYIRWLQRLNEPMIDDKFDWSSHSIRRSSSGKLLIGSDAVVAGLRRAVENCLKYRGTKAVLLDEAQHLHWGSPALRVKGDSWLGWRQNTFTEQVDAGTAIHGALDQLESVDLAFHLAVAPGQ